MLDIFETSNTAKKTSSNSPLSNTTLIFVLYYGKVFCDNLVFYQSCSSFTYAGLE